MCAPIVYSFGELAVYGARLGLARRRARRRAHRAELAAMEAGDDSPTFAPDAIRQEVALMLELVERGWATGEDTLAGRPDAEALRRWARHMNRVHRHPRVRGLVDARLVHVVNRQGDREDRVDVWLRIRVGPRKGPRIDQWFSIRRFDQHWTLGRRGERWELLAFREDAPAGRTLRRRLIPMPWSDRERLHGESLRELAAAEPATAGDLTDESRDAAHRARDLSLIDARYSEPVIESVLLRLLDAWEQAALGRPDLLERLATQRAADALRRKLAGEGLELAGWRVVRLDDARAPARISIDLTLRSEHRLRWVLEASESSDPLWRLAGASDPLRDAGRR